MNDYNKRFLKNILEDLREENDKNFLEEIEDAANTPEFANNEENFLKFQKLLNKKSHKQRNNTRKILLRVASVFLALLIGATVATLSVKSLREKLWSFFSNKSNNSYSLIVSSDNTDTNEFAAYEGKYIPTCIPEGYSVDSIENSKTYNLINLSDDAEHIISYSEFDKECEAQLQIDKENFDTYEKTTIAERETILASKDGFYHLLIIEVDAIIYITCNDPEVDFFGFASYIDKK